ncbi:mitochondrial ornithine / amino acid carrier protein [Blumeria hordei DH14]|uniref:Mitochondrial ornithine / amino acid carrier protein n=1 Tax=Blumeria graminis f. sp. hordei (strain DH14) TaxID=546991 RepID=N1JL08_BLUG1|nr:mitochondrial ornithine / amino acid carrier protein [Blumeria hordei DH14]
MDALEDVLFGSIAGLIGKYIEYPFDTVKVRLQSQPDSLPLRYTGPLDCFRQSISSSGNNFSGILSLYRGISAPLAGAALENSSLFFWERIARVGLRLSGFFPEDAKLPLVALWLTGAASGAATSFLLTPIELVKCKIQVATNDSATIKPLTVVKEVWRRQGLKGFWNGQQGTLIRETGGSAAWFGTKESASSLFCQLNQNPKSPTYNPCSNNTTSLPLYQQAIAGALAGMSYNLLFFPADTIKSRIQTSSMAERENGFWQEGRELWKHHGLKGLYRGCGITVLRSAPSSAFIFCIYDGLKRSMGLTG